jgi:hypothetical protein
LGRTTPIATRSCGLVHQNRMRCAATLARGAKIADSTPHTILLNMPENRLLFSWRNRGD